MNKELGASLYSEQRAVACSLQYAEAVSASNTEIKTNPLDYQ
jgi:hypothetical protein